VHVIACTLPCRIISASERPISAVDMAPAMVRNILPPPFRRPSQASAASTTVAALKWRKWCFTKEVIVIGPEHRKKG